MVATTARILEFSEAVLGGEGAYNDDGSSRVIWFEKGALFVNADVREPNRLMTYSTRQLKGLFASAVVKAGKVKVRRGSKGGVEEEGGGDVPLGGAVEGGDGSGSGSGTGSGGEGGEEEGKAEFVLLEADLDDMAQPVIGPAVPLEDATPPLTEVGPVLPATGGLEVGEGAETKGGEEDKGSDADESEQEDEGDSDGSLSVSVESNTDGDRRDEEAESGFCLTGSGEESEAPVY